MTVQKFFKYVGELNEKGTIEQARETAAYFRMSIDEQLLYNVFLDDGVYMVKNRGETYLVAVKSERTYDSSYLWFFAPNSELLVDIWLYIVDNPKIGLYKKEQQLLNSIRKSSFRAFEYSEETLLRYVFFNFNDKVYLLKWKLEHGKLTKKQARLFEKNLRKLLNRAEKELEAEFKQERNVEQLLCSESGFEEYDNYNYYNNDIIVNIDSDKKALQKYSEWYL